MLEIVQFQNCDLDKLLIFVYSFKVKKVRKQFGMSTYFNKHISNGSFLLTSTGCFSDPFSERKTNFLSKLYETLEVPQIS